MKLPSGENNNNSVHPEWTVRVTSTPNCNLPCAQKKPNPTHKPVTWWDHMRAPACMPIPGINAYGIIPEHLPKDWTFCWSCTWCFCCFFFFCIIYFTVSTFLSLFLSLPLSLLFLCHNPLFSLPTIISAPSHPLSPCLHLSLLPSPNLSPHYPSLLHTHHLLTRLLYQLYKTPAPYNPWQKHPPL
jgi:hypothetical protein